MVQYGFRWEHRRLLGAVGQLGASEAYTTAEPCLALPTYPLGGPLSISYLFSQASS